MSKHGSLINEQPPCFAANQDYFTNSWFKAARNILFVAGDMMDVALLRMFHFPVTISSGLDSLNGDGLRLLCGHPYRVDENYEENPQPKPVSQRAEICQRGAKLALVAWNIAELRREVPAGLPPIVARLAEAQQAFGFDVSNILIWRPRSSVVDQIRLGAELRDRKLVRDSLLSTFQDSMYDVESFYQAIKPKAESPKLDFCVARRELLAALKQAKKLNYASPELDKKLDKLNSAFDEAIIEPLLRDAARTSDSLESTLLMSAAELSERLHVTSPLVQSAQQRNLRGSSESNGEMDPEVLKHRLCAVEQLINIRKELRGK